MSGKIFVISGPSGVGKGTVIDLAKPKLINFCQISTITTREKRKGDRDERDRQFMPMKKFKEMIKNNEFLEYNFYDKNYYGTPKKEVMRKLKIGQNILLEIDINGAKNIQKQYSQKTILIFIWTKLKNIEKRLRKRGQNSEMEIRERIDRAQKELKMKENYDFDIENKEGKSEKAARMLVRILNNSLN